MIENVELFNWKAFDHLQVSFSEGINFITGANGIGKSSVLQAICMAFTGQVPNGFEGRNLIRKGAESASIILKFRGTNELLRIERHLSARGREKCYIMDSADKPVFSGSWDEVTEYIENHLKIRKFLFNSLYFMPEGDVYRTIQEPPGKQLLNEIDKLMGIAQLQSLSKEVTVAKTEFQEEMARQTEILKGVKISMQTAEELHVHENRLLVLQESKDEKKAELDQLTREFWESKEQQKQLETLHKDLLLLEQEEKTFLLEKERIDSLQKELEQIQKRTEMITIERLAVKARLFNIEKIIDVISTTQQPEQASIKCPVCGKPISTHEIEAIKNELITDKSLQEKKDLELLDSSRELETRKEGMLSEQNKLREREAKLRVLKEKYMNEPLKVGEVQREMTEIIEKVRLLEEKIEQTEKSLRTSEVEIGDLREKIGKTGTLERYRNLEISKVTDDLRSAARGEYVSGLTLKAIEELIMKQRDSELREKLYRNISRVWSNIKGEQNWTIKLDDSALPSAQLESQEYPFHILSAGEKTALLVVTRTLLSTLFAKEVDFLLLDEPLEHLDARNRHSLLQFLADIRREGIVKQMIITTTEYSLIRRLADYEHVSIISLENLKTMQSSQS
jgi:DNA repair exonuclease SbcCD ATPase subunit